MLKFRKAVGYAKFKDLLAQPKEVVFIVYILSSFSKMKALFLCFCVKEREERLNIFLIGVSFIASYDGRKILFQEEKLTSLDFSNKDSECYL